MSKDPYQSNMFKKANPYYKKNTVRGRNVVVLSEYFDNRGLQLIRPISRAVKQHDVHEMIITDESAQPGDTVNRIAYLCFVEITSSGVILRGDDVRINGKSVGEISGFDETHMPNHLNIVIKGNQYLCGKDLNIQLNDSLEIIQP